MNKSIVWAICALVTLISSCFVSVSFWFFSPFLISALSGALFAFFVFMALCRLDSIFDLGVLNDPYYEEQYEKMRKYGTIGIAGAIIGFMVSIIIIGTVNNRREDEKFKSDGVNVKGRVYSGTEEIGQAQITVQFRGQDKEIITTVQKISKAEFHNLYNGQLIEMIYCKTNPEMVKLILDKESIKKYKNINERSLIATDIEKMWGMPYDSIKLNVLDKISVDWQFSVSKNHRGFENISKKESLLIEKDRITFITNGIFNREAGAFLKPLNVKKEIEPSKKILDLVGMGDSKAKVKIFQTDKFNIIQSVELIREKLEKNRVVTPPELLYIYVFTSLDPI